jgi:hypothetical protein
MSTGLTKTLGDIALLKLITVSSNRLTPIQSRYMRHPMIVL